MGIFSTNSRLQEDWTFNTGTPIVCPATAAVIDGQHRIIVGTKDGRTLCLSHLGEPIWIFKTESNLSPQESFFVDEEHVHSVDAPPLVADIDRDGRPEILAGTEMGILYCLSTEGKLLWQHDCGGSIRASPVAEDINMDGHPEVLVGSSNNKLTALTANGKKLFEYISDAPIESVPAVLRSEKLLIIFGNDAGELTAILPTQDVAWKVHLKDKITAKPAFFETSEEKRLVIGSLAGTLYCVSEHGEIVWEFRTEGSIYRSAAVADLDGDGTPEILFGSCDNNVYAVTTEGKRLWSYETDFWVTDTPVVADLDGDGRLEVIAGSYDNNIYVLDSQGAYMMDYVPGISGIVNQAGHYSNILTSEPGEQTGKKLSGHRLKSMIVGCTLMERQVIVNTKEGNVSLLHYGA